MAPKTTLTMETAAVAAPLWAGEVLAGAAELVLEEADEISAEPVKT
jgi:hypothetical protein